MARLVLILAMVLAGCSTQPPRTITVTREVKIPVPVRAEPSPTLKACGYARPEFRFYRPDDPRYSVALTAIDATRLREWVDAKQNCIDAWRTFYE